MTVDAIRAAATEVVTEASTEVAVGVNAPLDTVRQHPAFLVMAGVQLGISLLIWMSSGLIIITVMKSSILRSQYFFQYLLNLSVATIISRVAYPILLLWLLVKYARTGEFFITNPDICFVTLAFGSCYRSILSSSVLLIALERYITILKPLTHCYILTDERIKYSLAASWLLSLAFVSGMVVHRSVFEAPETLHGCHSEIFALKRVAVAQVIFVALTFLGVIAIYTHLHMIAHRHLQIIEDERRIFGLAHFQRNLKRSYVALAITVPIFLFEVPIFVIISWSIWDGQEGKMLTMKIVSILTAVSQISHPLILSLLSSDFRAALKRLFKNPRVHPMMVNII